MNNNNNHNSQDENDDARWFKIKSIKEAKEMGLHELHILVAKAATKLYFRGKTACSVKERAHVFTCMCHEYIDADQDILVSSYANILEKLIQ